MADSKHNQLYYNVARYSLSLMCWHNFENYTPCTVGHKRKLGTKYSEDITLHLLVHIRRIIGDDMSTNGKFFWKFGKK